MPLEGVLRNLSRDFRLNAKIVAAVLILALPSALALVAYLLFKPAKTPTGRNASGSVAVLAGSGAPRVRDGRLRDAGFSDPFGIAIDRRGNLIVADGGQSNRIRRITAGGSVETLAGSTEGFADGEALGASFNTPSGVAVASDGSIIIADTSNNRIRKLRADGRVTTIAGNGRPGYRDGSATECEFDGPIGVAIDGNENIFVADTYNDRIRRISADGTVSTLAGSGSPGFDDGAGEIASFDTPCGIAADQQGNLFVVDTANNAVRKITPQGDVSTIAGGPVSSREDPPRTDQSSSSVLKRPVGIAITHDQFLFVTDDEGGRILRISPEGEVGLYAGGETGFADGAGSRARFNSPAGIAVDREGHLFVADSQNYLIRLVSPVGSQTVSGQFDKESGLLVQPVVDSSELEAGAAVPRLDRELLGIGQSLPWPLSPQDQWHEITGVVGEARGSPGGPTLDHLHSGLDIRGRVGDAVLSVLGEKVSGPIPNWDFGGQGEGIHVAAMTYIHIRVGRNEQDQLQSPEKFKPRLDPNGKLLGVRVRRGARFDVGEFIGTLNGLNHVHLNVGPWNAEVNPIQFPFSGFQDTSPPVVEASGIEVLNEAGTPFAETLDGRLLISGDVRVVVTAYDRVDGSGPARKLGIYKLGYQLVGEDGAAVRGFEEPVFNIEFNRLPPGPSSVNLVYAVGSGVSAYGTPTRFKYIVTNRVRDGMAIEGLLRTSALEPGRYILRVIAEDHAGNRAAGKLTELTVTVKES